MHFHEEPPTGRMSREELGRLFYQQILPYESIPQMPVTAALDIQPLIGRIVSNSTLVFGHCEVVLQGHGLNLFNSILFQRRANALGGNERPLRSYDIRQFGYRVRDGRAQASASTFFSSDMADLINLINDAASEPVLVADGSGKGRHYYFLPWFHPVDERLTQEQIVAQYARLRIHFPISTEQQPVQPERIVLAEPPKAQSEVQDPAPTSDAPPTPALWSTTTQLPLSTGYGLKMDPRAPSIISSTQGLPKEKIVESTVTPEALGTWRPAEQTDGRFVSMTEFLTTAEIARALGVDVGVVQKAVKGLGFSDKANTEYHGTVLRDIRVQIVGVPFGYIKVLARKLSEEEQSSILRYLEDNGYELFGDEKMMSPQAATILSKGLATIRKYAGSPPEEV